MDDIFSQVAPIVLTILRLSAGILLTFVALWAAVDYEGLNPANALFFSAFGIIALGEAVALRWLTELIATKWVRKKPISVF